MKWTYSSEPAVIPAPQSWKKLMTIIIFDGYFDEWACDWQQVNRFRCWRGWRCRNIDFKRSFPTWQHANTLSFDLIDFLCCIWCYCRSLTDPKKLTAQVKISTYLRLHFAVEKLTQPWVINAQEVKVKKCQINILWSQPFLENSKVNKLVRLIALQYAARKCKQNKRYHTSARLTLAYNRKPKFFFYFGCSLVRRL